MEWRSDEHADSVKLTKNKTRIDAAHRIERQQDAGIWENVFLMHFNAFIHHLDGVLNCLFDFGVHIECTTLQQRQRGKMREGERMKQQCDDPNNLCISIYGYRLLVMIAVMAEPTWFVRGMYQTRSPVSAQWTGNGFDFNIIFIVRQWNKARHMQQQWCVLDWLGSVRFGWADVFVFAPIVCGLLNSK